MNRSPYTEKTLYRSRNGVLGGVCQGISTYYDLNVTWVRVAVVFLTLMTGLWPGILVYIIQLALMKEEPVLPLETAEDEEFYHSYSGSRSMALQRLKRTYDSLDRRIQRIENAVTTRDFDWEERLNQ
jgi:phage shock protein C